MNPHSTVHAYIRVSTVAQEAGYGREAQEAAIRRFCLDVGLQEPILHLETGSGENIKERDVIQELMATLGSNDTLIFYKMDRLSRKMFDLEFLIGHFIDAGVVLHSTQAAESSWLTPERVNDPQTKLMRRIMGSIIEFDRELVIERMQSGCRTKASQGGFTGGKPPFGYRIKGKDDLEPDPEKIECVKAIVDWHQRGYSQEQIRARLKSLWPDIKAYGKDTPIVWSEKAVSRIIDRIPLYTQGLYRDRHSDTPSLRPDLVICPLAPAPESIPRHADHPQVEPPSAERPQWVISPAQDDPLAG